jgi:DNA-binding CsgD family transcriptional regulator
MRHRLRALRRDQLPVLGAAVERVVHRVCERAEPLPELDAASILTPKQLASWDLARRGLGSRAAAKALGISRDAHRDRVERATKRLAAGTPARAAHAPEWTDAAMQRAVAAGDDDNATLVRLRCAGATYRRCAEALRVSVAAVASRLARMWRRWTASLSRPETDTALPSATFSDDEREVLRSEGDAQHAKSARRRSRSWIEASERESRRTARRQRPSEPDG